MLLFNYAFMAEPLFGRFMAASMTPGLGRAQFQGSFATADFII